MTYICGERHYKKNEKGAKRFFSHFSKRKILFKRNVAKTMKTDTLVILKKNF